MQKMQKTVRFTGLLSFTNDTFPVFTYYLNQRVAHKMNFSRVVYLTRVAVPLWHSPEAQV